MHNFGVVIPGASTQPHNSRAGNSFLEHLPSRPTLELVTLFPPFISPAWDVQCSGPASVAERTHTQHAHGTAPVLEEH